METGQASQTALYLVREYVSETAYLVLCTFSPGPLLLTYVYCAQYEYSI